MPLGRGVRYLKPKIQTLQAEPRPHAPRSPKSARPPVSEAMRGEETDDYPRIAARLNPRWRVVSCRDSLQWILQSRCGQRAGLARWKSRFFCRSRGGLVSCCLEHAGPVGGAALALLLRLPSHFGGAP